MKNLRYNGNISSMQWQNGASAAKSGYKFSYDGLNRLTSAIYGEGDDMSQNADRFSEKGITYNANGSIYRMKRYGMLNDGSYGLVDDLKIKLDGNALYGITDYAAETNYKGSANFVDADGSGQEYWFNGNGSLSADANKGIARIDYDNYGCPRKIVFINGNTTEYVYSSTGEKLRTTHKTAIDGITVALNSNDNLKNDDFLSEDKTDYHGSFIYENGKLDKVLYQGGYVQNDSICAGSLGKPRGFTHTDNTSLNILEQVYVYHYYTQDHLGNNRAVIDEDGNVKQVTNYYPFGGVFSTTAYNSGDDLQPYKYNGKELDRTHGLDWYDYGARNYDAFLPMFTSLDPHCESYYNISPYAYCANNPIMFVDPDGENPVFSSNGMFLGCTSEGYTGQIYIYNFNADLPEDEILDVSKLSDYSIKELSNFNGVSSMDDVELSGDAIGNIMTNILERWDGKMVFDEKFTMASINNRVRYDNPKNCDWNFESRYYPGEKNGKIYVSPLYKDSYESTVENLEATMLGHEWYSHIIKDYGDDHNNHSLAYENSMRFSLIYNKSLTPKYIDFCGVMLWCYRYNEFFHKTK
ncbi:MAG: RHS repeat-associated core domain-containing protein [Bacteroidaceae bacterium]|nr:RHS repeat-associated core domain-containing protein [Bacteroidaceae bacterium]